MSAALCTVRSAGTCPSPADLTLDLHAILVRAPVNRLAAAVVSQRRSAKADEPLKREELIYLISRLERKHRLLKQVLGVKTKAQHVNLMYKHKKRLPQFRQKREPRAFLEYVALGQHIQRLVRELAAMKERS